MNSTVPEPSAVPNADAASDLDARYAAFLAELTASVDHPKSGETARSLLAKLAKNPEWFRWAWEFDDATFDGSDRHPGSPR